jgi:septum formation protein
MQDVHSAAPKFQFVLGSQSPRRKELLGHLNIPFIQLSADIDEVSTFKDPAQIVEDLAAQKGKSVANQLHKNDKEFKNPFILSSDTIVCLKDEILGKPQNSDQARETLLKLSGKTHTVYTGVSLRYWHPLFGESEQIKNFHSATDVTFGQIDEETLELYLETGDSLDKAGAYGIQGMGLSFIKSIKGSYSTVVGLPLADVSEKLAEILGPYPESGGWRGWFTNPRD